LLLPFSCKGRRLDLVRRAPNGGGRGASH
jgi:hypothetical protein